MLTTPLFQNVAYGPAKEKEKQEKSEASNPDGPVPLVNIHQRDSDPMQVRFAGGTADNAGTHIWRDIQGFLRVAGIPGSGWPRFNASLARSAIAGKTNYSKPRKRTEEAP